MLLNKIFLGALVYATALLCGLSNGAHGAVGLELDKHQTAVQSEAKILDDRETLVAVANVMKSIFGNDETRHIVRRLLLETAPVDAPPVSRLGPKKPSMSEVANEQAPAEGACAHSIFETRIPINELVPDEGATRLTASPGRHPNRNICGSYANKDSCCTDKMLQDLVAWSDAIDSSIQFSRYVRSWVERDPRMILDSIIITIRSIVPPETRNTIDWKGLRNRYRDKVGRIIGDWWKTMFPPLNKLWVSIVTYQEGLLCSACEPNFSRFYDPATQILKLRTPGAEAVGDSFVDAIRIFDEHLSDQNTIVQIKDLVKEICVQFVGEIKCMTVPTMVNTVINYLTGPYLRNMICAAAKGTLPERNEKCKDFAMQKMLRGLILDTAPLISNVYDYAYTSCPKGFGIDCEPISAAKQQTMDLLAFSFDERPLATNAYTPDGYDILGAACDSNLSGYACGKPGPKPESHNPDTSTGNSGAVIITLVILITLGVVGAVLFISRHRIIRVTQSWYTRMRDGDDFNGPTVGLV